MNRFALIGAAGYVAPRHMRAIADTGHNLVAALDISDSVGIIDSFFPNADFFTEFERFDRHIDLRRREGRPIDYVSICSPNYLHDAHVRFALRAGANVICEKPLVLNPWNLDGLLDMEKDTGGRVSSILQLRLHPSIIALKEKVAESPNDTKFDVDLTYITSRGRWYDVSWKGDVSKAGGIATNIGVHFFDMLHFAFGAVQKSILHHSAKDSAAGFLEFERARVRWFLSINADHRPKSIGHDHSQRTIRCITVDSNEIEFSGGFTDLHTISYERILAGDGFGIEENRAAVSLVSDIRNAQPIGREGDYHPFLLELDL